MAHHLLHHHHLQQQHITVTRMPGLPSKVKIRKPLNTCLLCYREYNIDNFKYTERGEVLDIDNNHNAFTIFCKILDVDATIYSAAWDFSMETMPFCASCNSLAYRLSNLYDELAVVQQEIILNTQMIKGTLVGSQQRSSLRGASDRRVDAFRNQVFQMMRRMSSKTKYDDRDIQMKQYEEQSVIENEVEQKPLIFHRHTIEEAMNGVYYGKYHESRAVPVSQTPSSPDTDIKSMTHTFYKVPYNMTEQIKYKKQKVSNRYTMEKEMIERNEAHFTQNDIEVVEIEESKNMTNNNDMKTPNRNLNIYDNNLEAQLRIQLSYDQYFKPEVSNGHMPFIKSHYVSPVSLPPSSTIRHQPHPNDHVMIVDEDLDVGSPHSSNPPDSPQMTPTTELTLRKSSGSDSSTHGSHHCPICDKQYGKPYQLKAHLRLHTGEKPYKCSICTKTFRLAGNLRVHIRVHTGETPYECQFCGKRCTQKSQLNTHVLIHHKKSELLKN